MKKLLFVVGGLAVFLALFAAGAFFKFRSDADALLTKQVVVHSVDFPIPFPLSEAELDALRAERAAKAPAAEAPDATAAPAPSGAAAPDPLAGVDLEALALERAVARGKHLVNSRYACVECHGKDFGGGIMVDDPAIGTWTGPNLTKGEGGVTAAYEPADWDRIVRHGINRAGNRTMMPAEDFRRMSDQELSDIIAYLRSRPEVDKAMPPVTLGPLGTVLVALGELPLAYDRIENHDITHARFPPKTEKSVTFGEHMAGICTGCHGPNFSGGPILGGYSQWPPALNLTPHESGLKGWTFEQFKTAMVDEKRPDGSGLRDPMTRVTPYVRQQKPVEMEALWLFLQSLEPRPTGE